MRATRAVNLGCPCGRAVRRGRRGGGAPEVQVTELRVGCEGPHDLRGGLGANVVLAAERGGRSQQRPSGQSKSAVGSLLPACLRAIHGGALKSQLSGARLHKQASDGASSSPAPFGPHPSFTTLSPRSDWRPSATALAPAAPNRFLLPRAHHDLSAAPQGRSGPHRRAMALLSCPWRHWENSCHAQGDHQRAALMVGGYFMCVTIPRNFMCVTIPRNFMCVTIIISCV